MPHLKFSPDWINVLRSCAEECDVWLTAHAPYFVNLSARDEDTRKKSIDRLVSTLKVAQLLNAHQVVFHPGYYGGLPKQEALKLCIEGMKEAVERAKAEGVRKAYLGPETTGKKSQVGDLNEILTMCEEVDMTLPTVDWAHLHARGIGAIKSKGDYAKMLDEIEKRLGLDVVKNLHCHYTPVEFTDKGEKEHHTMEEPGYGPDFEPLAELIAELGFNPVIISESPILDLDSIRMKTIVERFLRKAQPDPSFITRS